MLGKSYIVAYKPSSPRTGRHLLTLLHGSASRTFHGGNLILCMITAGVRAGCVMRMGDSTIGVVIKRKVYIRAAKFTVEFWRTTIRTGHKTVGGVGRTFSQYPTHFNGCDLLYGERSPIRISIQDVFPQPKL